MFRDYARRCKQGEVRLGEPYLYVSPMPPWVLNFPTKGHWRPPSQLSDIVTGLDWVERYCGEWGVQSLACPALGCGTGQLEWQVVGPVLYQSFCRLNIPVQLYAPPDTPQEQMATDFLAQHR